MPAAPPGAYLEQRNRASAFKWALRVGVHSGPVVAGVVGKRKYAYDIVKGARRGSGGTDPAGGRSLAARPWSG